KRADPVAEGIVEKSTCPTTFAAVVRSIWNRLPPFEKSSCPAAVGLLKRDWLTIRGTKKRRGPSGPCGPAGPEGPGGPAGPAEPAGPAGPTGPAGPCKPGGPWGPAAPGGPAGPWAPAGP